MPLSERDLLFLFDFLDNCFGNAGSCWCVKRSLFWERHGNSQGGKSYVVFSSVSSLSERKATRVAFICGGATPPCLSQRVFLENTNSSVVAEHWKSRRVWPWSVWQVCAPVSTQSCNSPMRNQSSTVEVEDCWASDLVWKLMAFYHRLTLATQTKNGVWD